MNYKKAFQWDEIKEKAAEAVAKGELSQERISSDLGIGVSTLKRWMKENIFQRKIDEIIQDIDVAQKSERIKIAKKEIKRIVKRLELNEDKPGSRDLVALLKYVGEETGDYEPTQKVKHEISLSDKIKEYEKRFLEP